MQLANTHPDPALLRAVDEGVLADEVAQEVRAHLKECEVCTALRDDLEALTGRASNVVTMARADNKKWWGMAAVAAVLAVVAFLFLRPTPKAAEVQIRAEAPQPTPMRLPLDQAPLRLPLESAVLLRGVDQDPATTAYLRELGAALEAYRAQDFARAGEQLRALQERYPKAVEPPFYRAVSSLLAGAPAEALTLLEQARGIGGEALDDDIAWYLAVATERSQGWEAAKPLVDRICRGPSQYKQSACASLSK